MRLLGVAAIAVCGFVRPLPSQGIPVGTAAEDRWRLDQLTGLRPVAAVSARPLAPDSLPTGAARLDLSPVELRFHSNSDRPWGTNDGAVWQGRGPTIAFGGGATARRGRFTLSLAPIVVLARNKSFPLSPLATVAGRSSFSYPVVYGGTIDLPQRFGNDALTTVDWGGSGAEVGLGPMAVAFTHEGLWWGPGTRNAIVMTNSAPGFWHARVATARPLPTRLGSLDARWIFGSLRESAYFDTVSANDRRFVTGAVVTLMPRGAKGLELGAARVFTQAWPEGGLGLDDVLLMFKPFRKNAQATPGNPTGEDLQDQIASIFIRWVAPASGFEIYGEWAKGDHSANFRDLLVEPEHASGYLAGFQKVISASPSATWRLTGEMTILGAPRTTQVRSAGAGFFYVHTKVPQGYTHLGQMLGAGIGPGSSQHSVRLDRFAAWGRAGVTFFRTVYDNDRYYRQSGTNNFWSHEVEPSVAADALVGRGPWEFTGGVTVSRLLNQHYIFRNDQWNLNLAAGVRHTFAGPRDGR